MDADKTTKRPIKMKTRTEEEKAYANEKLKKANSELYDPSIKEPKKN